MQRNTALILLIFIVIAWGCNWPVTKLIILEIPPLWATSLRSAIAAVAIGALQIITKQYYLPTRQDIPAILIISFFHMVLFGALMAIGLQYTSVGRSVILAFTTPLWVSPAAVFFLREHITKQQIFGIILGIFGVILLFAPSASTNMHPRELLGNSLLLAAALFWSVSIVYTRGHTWKTTPLKLAFWQQLLAASLLAIAALFYEGLPQITMSTHMFWLLLYSGIISTALGFWAMTAVNAALPAIVTSLGLLATPLVGMTSSLFLIGEKPDLPLIIASVLILSGIVLGSMQPSKK